MRPSQGRNFTHFDLIVVSPLTRFVVEICVSSHSLSNLFLDQLYLMSKLFLALIRGTTFDSIQSS